MTYNFECPGCTIGCGREVVRADPLETRLGPIVGCFSRVYKLGRKDQDDQWEKSLREFGGGHSQIRQDQLVWKLRYKRRRVIESDFGL